MARVFADSLQEKSVEDQNCLYAMMQKLQDRMDRQGETMQSMLLCTDRSRRPEGFLSAKDTPDVDEFKHAFVAEENAQSDFLVTFRSTHQGPVPLTPSPELSILVSRRLLCAPVHHWGWLLLIWRTSRPCPVVGAPRRCTCAA